ncbi:glutamate ABC transporter substrate-binding protein [Arthrobacter sp. H35-D1]|uniref:glutamate ABC transporter substrate-binding protein n=1 Tax=Arthrobacter sp. H35-D1 TaxID=3046202 RepID=UPI0024B9B694|nr:glutamate ABC transporter substrate-binding protein [Arthrobacter sp. H35-D1]MDJ0314121.1 glutamate ABC transporter substrate-binding protein [Arthrobacter sp. H35-D1]
MTGCGGDTAGGGSSDGGNGGDAPFEVAKDVALTGSPTFDKIKSSGAIRIGVKEDQPGLGYLDAATGERSGFDIEIATWMAAKLGVAKDKIEFKAIPSANRETALANGDVDLYVGTYSITDKRKKLVDFAGPYFITGQGLLVQKSNETIKSEKDLAGKKVCSATGSTPIQNIRENFPKATPVEFDIYSKCVDALKSGSVDAVTTDQAILLGFASQDPDNLKVVGEPFTVEKYGIGLPKGDTALRTFLNETLTDGNATWTKIYDSTLGKSGTKVEQPKVDQY